MPVSRFRSLWISDTHLGSRAAKSAQLYDFLLSTESEYLYLVGDIFDLWKVQKNWHWKEINNNIVQLIIKKAQAGTKVFYLPGNHDSILRNYCNTDIRGIKVRPSCTHISSNNTKFLVIHGDQFDSERKRSIISKISKKAYDFLVLLTFVYNAVGSCLKLPYFSLSAYCRRKYKAAMGSSEIFQEKMLAELNRHQVDGIICGHQHRPDISLLGKYLYTNTGDWVENCTALAENMQGTIGLINWQSNYSPTQSVSHPPSVTLPYRDGCFVSIKN